MLVPVIIVYLMCTPMGYVVGRQYIIQQSKRVRGAVDREKELEELSFIPIFCAILLPLASILAIQQIMKGN